MKLTLGLCLLFLSACVSQNTVLMNSRGQTVQCRNWGVGILGAPIAYAEHQECVKSANAAGYTINREIPDPKPAPAKSSNPNGT
jgi:hypothetical protein